MHLFLTDLSLYLPVLPAYTSTSSLRWDWNSCILSLPLTVSLNVKPSLPLSVTTQHAGNLSRVSCRGKNHSKSAISEFCLIPFECLMYDMKISSCLRNIWHSLSRRMAGSHLQAYTSPRATAAHSVSISLLSELSCSWSRGCIEKGQTVQTFNERLTSIMTSQVSRWTNICTRQRKQPHIGFLKRFFVWLCQPWLRWKGVFFLSWAALPGRGTFSAC